MRRIASFAGVCVMLACGGSDGPAGLKPDSRTVDAAGGTVEAASGAVSLRIPAGALSQSTTITVEPAASAPADPGLVGNTAYDFGPDGLQFTTPVELELSYERESLPAGVQESGLGIYKQVGSGWVRVPGGRADAATQTVIAPISSFSVYAVLGAGPAASLAKVSGDSQDGWIGVAVTEKPTVRVTDSSGRAVPGATVTFAAGNGGSVAPATASTDAEGLASTTWTLGDAGANTLTASAAGLAPVTFTATAVDPCVSTPLEWPGDLGINGSLTNHDCLLPSGRFVDLYQITTSSQAGLRMTLSTSQFQPFIVGYQADGQQVVGMAADGEESVVHAYAVVAPGTYDLGVTALATNGSTGDYYFVLAPFSGYEGCQDFFMTAGVSINGRVQSGDCEDEFDNEPTVVRWYDGYTLMLYPGETATVTVSAQFPYRFTYWRDGSYVTGHFGAPAGSSRTHTVTAGQTGFYGFFIISEHHQGTGDYNLTASVTGGTGPSGHSESRRLTDMLAVPR